jgi:hypothetical protein
MQGPGYLPGGSIVGKSADVNPVTTLSKLPLADLLNVISQAKMPDSGKGADVDGIKQDVRPPSAHQRPPTRKGACANREGSARNGPGSRPDSARPSSGSRPSSASRPQTPRPQTPRRNADGLTEFVRHVPHGRPFSPRVEFLEAKIVGNGSQWDQDRLVMPERAFPCIAKGAAEFHDRNAERENRPAWKPTCANRVSGMGVQTDAAFPLPPRPLSARPRSALRTPRGLR